MQYTQGENTLSDAETVKKLKRYVEYLVELRRPWSEAWGMVKDYVRPVRPWNENGIGNKRTTLEDLISGKIMDGSAGRAVRILAAGLLSGLTPPSRPWFALKVDDALMESGEVKNWLWRTQELIYSSLARSGFYATQQSLNLDLAAFCNACVSRHTVPGKGIRYMDAPVGSYVWDVDPFGKVCTVARVLYIAGGDLARQYGRKVSGNTWEKAQKDPYKPVPVVHIVMPRERREQGKIDRLNKPYASYVYEEQSGHLIEEGGFDALPYLNARWDTLGGEIYGRGVGFDVISDVRMLQTTSRDQAEAIRMYVKPPMLVPASMKDRLWLIPGGINYKQDGMPADTVTPLYQVQADIAAISGKIADLRQAIRDGYFNDLFLMISGTHKNMTATEVAERNAEKLMVLGPVVESHQTDILDPAIEGEFNFLLNSGALDPVPQELAGHGINIEFTSILAQAQKMPQAAAIRGVLGDVGNMARLKPEILDKIDFDQAVDELGGIEGVPAKVIRSDDAVAAIREQRAQAEAQAQQMRQMQMMNEEGGKMIEAMSKLGKDGGGNILESISNMGNGGGGNLLEAMGKMGMAGNTQAMAEGA